MRESVDVSVVMGSKNDWGVMQHAVQMLRRLGLAHEARVISAHRTPDLCHQFAEQAGPRGVRAIIAGAGGAAALPGVIAAKTWVPVLGVPIEASALRGLDALLSMVQMPAGVPVGTLAIGRTGAVNAALMAAAIVAQDRPALRDALEKYRAERSAAVMMDDEALEMPG